MSKKQVLAAGIVRDIKFGSKEDMEIYLYEMKHKKQLYAVLENYERNDGSILARIVQQYNQSPLIELYSY